MQNIIGIPLNLDVPKLLHVLYMDKVNYYAGKRHLNRISILYLLFFCSSSSEWTIKQWWPVTQCKMNLNTLHFFFENYSLFWATQTTNKFCVNGPLLDNLFTILHVRGLAIRRVKSHRFGFLLCFGWGDVYLNCYVFICLLIFSVQWLESKTQEFEPTYLYTMEKVNVILSHLIKERCEMRNSSVELLVRSQNCVVLFSHRVTFCCLMKQNHGITFALQMSAYRHGIPALGTGNIHISGPQFGLWK